MSSFCERCLDPATLTRYRSRSASTCSKTIIFHERNQPKNETKSSSKVVNADGISRPSGFFASTHLSVETLFYLATLGGAQVCNLEDRIGNFIVGKEFDALLVQTGQKEAVVAGTNGNANGAKASLLEDELEKALAGGDSVLEDGVENPALMLESDEGIERVFEKFLFTVSGGPYLPSPVLADLLKLTLPHSLNRATIGICGRSLYADGRLAVARRCRYPRQDKRHIQSSSTRPWRGMKGDLCCGRVVLFCYCDNKRRLPSTTTSAASNGSLRLPTQRFSPIMAEAGGGGPPAWEGGGGGGRAAPPYPPDPCICCGCPRPCPCSYGPFTPGTPSRLARSAAASRLASSALCACLAFHAFRMNPAWATSCSASTPCWILLMMLVTTVL